MKELLGTVNEAVACVAITVLGVALLLSHPIPVLVAIASCIVAGVVVDVCGPND